MHQKVTLRISVVMLVLFWIILVAACLSMWSAGLRNREYWDVLDVAIIIFLSVAVVLLIPIQLVRYLRKLRKLQASKSDT
jgi:membrane protein YdbS with pleckstrin-like domain